MQLGWNIGKKSQYNISLPMLSSDEEDVILNIEKMFKDATKYKEFDNAERAEKEINKLLLDFCEHQGIIIDKEQEIYLTKTALYHIYGFAGIEELLNAPEIEEIAVIGLGMPVYVYLRRKGWRQTNLYYKNIDFAINLINKMSRTIGRRITYKNPRLNAILPDRSRLHASIPPVSELEITIRKFTQNPLTVFELLKYNTTSSEVMAVLWMLMQADISVLIAGNTASGKTTTLNSLFSFVPLNERKLITEETPEINIPHKHVVHLLSNMDFNIKLSDLVADSLRMRPDRVIVGEVRDRQEVSALMDTILSGQARGSYATFHAQSVHETLSRLLSLGVMDIDLRSINVIIVQKRMMRYNPKTRQSQEIRRIIEVAEINKQNGEIIPLFNYEPEKECWKACYESSELLSSVAESLGISKRELLSEIKKRKLFLDKNISKNWDFETAVAELQKFTYLI